MFSRATASKQPWLQEHLCRWSAESSGRTRAPPHIKTYTKVSEDNKELAYFMLTSANLSKAAWGSVSAAGNSCNILSYEAGVVWLPSFITGGETFTAVPFSQRQPGRPEFPLHFDLPLRRYSDKDRPWLIDSLM